ncbi:MAG: hypothetical protein RL148_677, partial [Planctomycetota bacterium]
RLGISANLDPKSLGENLDRARELQRKRNLLIARESEDNPILASMLRTDPTFSGMASDELDKLGIIEKTWAFTKQGWLRSAQGIYYDKIRQGLADDADLARLREIEESLKSLPSDSSGQGLIGGLWYGLWGTMGQFAESTVEAAAWAAAGAGTALALGQAGPQIALPDEVLSVPGMALAFGGGGLFSHSAAVQAGLGYKSMIDMGVNHETAYQASFGLGLFNGALDAFGLGFMTKIARQEIGKIVTNAVAKELLSKPTITDGAKRFVTGTFKGSLGELATEVPQEINQIVAEAYAVFQQKKIDPSKLDEQAIEDSRQYWERIGGIIAETVRGSLLFSSFGPAIRFRNDMQRIKAAERTEKFIKDLGAGLDASQMKDRSPTQLEKFLMRLSEGSKVDSFYFKPEEFQAAMEQAGVSMSQLEELAPDVAKSFKTSIGTEAEPGTGIMEIPAHTWGARFMTTEFGKSLSQDVRVDPDGMNYREVRQLEGKTESIVEDAKRILSEKEQSDKEFVAEVDTVRTDMENMLVSAGRTTDEAVQQSLLYSYFATVYSGHEKLRPSEWHAKHGLRIVGAEGMPQAGASLQQLETEGEAAPARKVQVATFFSGVGTLEGGLTNKTAAVVVENDSATVEAYNKTHGTKFKPSDVVKIDPKTVAGRPFHASPVCKNFSAAKNARTVEKLDMDSANAVARVIDEARPPSVTIENAPEYMGTAPMKAITDALDRQGYNYDVQVVNAADYGGNQNRKRMILRALPKGQTLPPLPQKQEPGDWFESIKDLIPAQLQPLESLPANEREMIAERAERGSLDTSKPILSMGGNKAFANSGGPAPTLVSSPKMVPRVILPGQGIFELTPRMMARLMGLPDTFEVPESRTLAKKVLGNGIHAAITKNIIEPIMDAAEVSVPPSTKEVVPAAEDTTRHQLVVERGERQTGRAVISVEERAEIAAAAKKHGISAKAIEDRVREHKRAFPTAGGWAPLLFTGLDVEEQNGVKKWEPKYKAIPYSFDRDDKGKGLKKGTEAYEKRARALSSKLLDEVRALYARAEAGDKNAQKILTQASWYREMRRQLRHDFGGLGDLFADLLGATSPNTPVRENWIYALEVLQRATRGDFDALMPRWEAWADQVEAGEIEFQAWYETELARLEAKEVETEPDRARRIAAIDADVKQARVEYEQRRIAEEEKTPTGTRTLKDGTTQPKPLTLSEIREESDWRALNRNAEKAAIRAEASLYTKKAFESQPEYLRRYDEMSKLRELPDDLIPVKESGAKYGFNGRNIVRTLVDLWRTVKEENAAIGRGETAPKALNFSGNLIGFRERATIDVWAARLLNRIAGMLRVPVVAESGVAGAMLPSGETTGQFGMGQDVFAGAVQLIRADETLRRNALLENINDDDLQAIVWFLEKEVWTKNNWTSAAGEGGSFEFESALAGIADREKIAELRRVADSSLSTPKEREDAIASLDAMKRRLDRFQGMVSQETSPGWQGEGHVPTDAEQAQLQSRLSLGIKESDPNAVIVGQKVQSTQALYGGQKKRAIDLEITSREGVNIMRLWRQMLVEARDNRQDSVALSRVLRDNEDIDYTRHRPGVEIYFREGKAMDKLESVLAKLEGLGVGDYTVITDGRPVLGAMAPVVGVRFQFVPEIDVREGAEFVNLSEQELAKLMEDKASEFIRLADRVASEVGEVSHAAVLHYETRVAFNGTYQEQINVIDQEDAAASGAEAVGEGAAGRTWIGQSAREGVAAASRRAAEAAAGRPAESGPAGQRPAIAGAPVPVDAAAAQGLSPLSAPTGRGAFFPELRLAVLNKNADPSTVIHEMAHFFFTTMVRVASTEGAPAQVVQDVETLLRWFADKGGMTINAAGNLVQQWNAMSSEQQEKFHEALAYNWEVYAYEGKAPTKGLQGVFDRMRTWMIRVYKNVRDKLNPIYRAKYGSDLPMLTPEVRAVFDRMLASEETITQAEEIRRMLPLYQSLDQFLKAGFSEEQWDEYQAVLQEAHDAAVTDLTKASLSQLRWLKNARSRMLKQIQKQAAEVRSAIEEAVEREVRQEQVYMAIELLKKAPGESKLSLEAVRSMIANLDEAERTAIEKRLGVGRNGMLSTKGQDPEAMATFFGYDSADQMVRALAGALPLQEEVAARAQKEMLTNYGELATPDMLEAAVEDALHSEARARFLAVEQKFLTKSQQPVRLLVAAAKFAARRILESNTVRSLRPDRYSQAEVRAAREAEAAIRPGKDRKSGDPEAAAKAKQRQLLNNQLVEESTRAREEIDKFIEWSARLMVANEKLADRGYDVNVVMAARWILARVGLATDSQVDRTVNYLELLERYNPTLFEELRPLMARFAQGEFDYRDLTLGEFQALMDAVKSLYARAKRDREIVLGERTMAVEEAVQRMAETVAGLVPGRIAGEVEALTDQQRVGRLLLGTKGNLTRVEHLFRALDGGERGAFSELMLDELRLSLDQYRKRATEFNARLVKLLRNVPMDNRPIVSKEFGYTFTNGDADILGLLLHMGNRSNMEKVLIAGRGPGFSWATFDENGNVDPSKWMALRTRLIQEGRLREEHFDFAQNVWNMLEEIKPLLQEAHLYLEGYYFKEVPAQEFTVEFKDGTSKTYRGGYVPAAADRDLMGTAQDTETLESMVEDFKQMMPKVQFGNVKERVDNYRKRPLTLDVREIATHIDKSMRYAYVQPRIRDVLKLLKGSYEDGNGNRVSLEGMLNRIHPNLVRNVLMPWLDRAATQSLYKQGGDPLWNAVGKFLRRNTGIAVMMLNPVNALQQLTGITASMAYVKTPYLVGALKRYGQAPRDVSNFILERSDFMRDRMDNQTGSLRTDLDEMLRDPSNWTRVQAWTARKAYALQGMVQNQVDIVTWMGSYDQTMANPREGETQADLERRAVLEANSTVRLAQGSFNPEDVANYEVGTPWQRAWTQFTGYFNNVLNAIGYAKDNKARTALVTFMIPMAISEAIAKTLWGSWKMDDPEEEEWMLDGVVWDGIDIFLLSQVRGAAAFVPAVGPAVYGFIEQQFGDRAFGDKVAASPALVSLYRSASGLVNLIKAAADEDRDLTGKTVRDSISAITQLTGLPLVVLARPLGYLVDWQRGKIEPTNPLDVARGLITGRASKASER